MTTTMKKKSTSKKMRQRKIADFLTANKIISDKKKIDTENKKLGTIFKGGYNKKTVTVKTSLINRDRKECNVMNPSKIPNYKSSAYLSNLITFPPKDGEERSIFLIRYKDGKKAGQIIGGGSSTYNEHAIKLGYKVKKLVDGFNKEGIKKYESFKTEKQKASFLLKADTFKDKNGDNLFTTDSKAGVIRFERI